MSLQSQNCEIRSETRMQDGGKLHQNYATSAQSYVMAILLILIPGIDEVGERWYRWSVQDKGDECFCLLANFATFPASARVSVFSNHICWIFLAFTRSCPMGTALIFIDTRGRLRLRLIKRPNMDPFGCRPFLSFDHRTAPMKAHRIGLCFGVQAEKQECITFARPNCQIKQQSFSISKQHLRFD